MNGFFSCSNTLTYLRRHLLQILPAILVFVLTSSTIHADQQLTPMVKQPAAPDFQLSDLEGTPVTMQDYRGKVLIINFWATWCPPCRAELPSMNRAWKKLEQQGVAMIAINIGEDEESIRSFLKDYPIDFQVLLDKDSQSLQQWQINGLPTSYVVGRNGFIYYQAVGDREWDNEQLLKKVLYLTKEPTK
jgi:peroxiredoxin